MSRFTITNENNFARVFKLPTRYPSGFCFDGGKLTTFIMIDWFNPYYQDKLFNGPVVLEGEKLEEHRASIKKFLVEKVYCHIGEKYLCITDYGDSIIFEKEWL